jgi:signal transduction histidine kinase
MLYYFLGNMVVGEKVDMLNRSGSDINDFFNEIYAKYQENPLLTTAFLEQLLDIYSRRTNSLVWLVDQNGYIRFAKPGLNSANYYLKFIRNSLNVEDPDNIRLPDERQYKKVMVSKDSVVEKGDFYGLFKETRVSWLTVEYPLVYNGNTVAAAYLMTPVPEIYKTRETAFMFFMVSVIISVSISFVLIYIFSRRFVKPLKQINNAARIIAGGEFTRRLDIQSQDEIGELAASFNQMVTALENLEEMRRGFIANVSHELRTPMTSIRGFVEGIIDGTIPPEKHKDYLAVVREETIRLNRLVNELLDLARMESGENKLTMKNFDINELIRRCIIKLENIITQKDISVEADFEEEEMFANADPDAIERVIINLIHNAVKFTDEKGKINISTRKRKDKIYVAIRDNGIGIEKSELGMIWDRFYKSDKSRGKDTSGTGLGLAIVKNLMNAHNQEIWVESEPGKGTVFTFTLAKGNEREIKEI